MQKLLNNFYSFRNYPWKPQLTMQNFHVGALSYPHPIRSPCPTLQETSSPRQCNALSFFHRRFDSHEDIVSGLEV